MANQEAAVAPVAPVVPLAWAIKTYAQKYPKGHAKAGELNGVIKTGLSIQPLDARGEKSGQDIWTSPYRDVCLRLAATFLEAAASGLPDAPVKSGATAGNTYRELTVEEFLAQLKAGSNGTGAEDAGI